MYGNIISGTVIVCELGYQTLRQDVQLYKKFLTKHVFYRNLIDIKTRISLLSVVNIKSRSLRKASELCSDVRVERGGLF